jgi:hypothetical protein
MSVCHWQRRYRKRDGRSRRIVGGRHGVDRGQVGERERRRFVDGRRSANVQWRSRTVERWRSFDRRRAVVEHRRNVVEHRRNVVEHRRNVVEHRRNVLEHRRNALERRHTGSDRAGFITGSGR